MSQKELCKWSKSDISGDFKTLIDIVKKPKFICEKCGRASSKKKLLCNPVKITR